jgi:anion-transporting  ArsA/GET3 family ATPase
MSAVTLSGKRLLVVTGKGGVGKSVVAAALGRLLADAGQRVLVLESDPRESLHQLFDCEPSGGTVVAAGLRLHIQNVSGTDAIEERVREQVKVATLSRRICGSEAFRTFVAGAPGLSDAAVLGHAQRLVEGKARGAPQVDTVLVDAPATGHGLSFLEAPSLVADTVGGGPFGEMAREVAEHVADAERSDVVAVTAAEEMPVDELLELFAALRTGVGRSPACIVVNALYPPWPRKRPPTGPAADLWRRRRAVNDHEIARLARATSTPRVELPLLPLGRGPELVAALAERLAEGGLG